MKQAMIAYVKDIIDDEWYTPVEGVLPLVKYLPRGKIYWECTDNGSSNITKVLRKCGYAVVSTHIDYGVDFLIHDPPFDFDIIITNHPFSKKDAFLERAYELGKPFCFLLPITTLEGVRRGALFRRYGIEVLVLDKRLHFREDKRNTWFNSSWFCWRILPSNLIFERIDDYIIDK